MIPASGGAVPMVRLLYEMRGSSLPPLAALLGCLLFAVGGCAPSKWRPPRRAVEVYDPAADSWSRGKPMPVRLAGARCVEIGGLLYVVCGRGLKLRASAHLLRFDPVSGIWEELADVPTRRWRHDVVAVGTDLYILGGGAFSATDNVEIFDTVSETWSVGPALLNRRDDLRAVELGGLIYVMGGSTDVVEVLDPGLCCWQAVGNLPETLRNPVAESDGVFIYVIGGKARGALSGEVWIYDPLGGVWTSGPPMPKVGISLDSGIIGTEIFLIGEFDGDRRRVFSLDTVALTWREPSPKKKSRFDVGVASGGGLLYTFGGRGSEEIE